MANKFMVIKGVSEHALMKGIRRETQIRKKHKDKIFKKKRKKKYRCIVMTMTAGKNLIAARSSNSASSSVMLAPTKSNTQIMKMCENNEIAAK